MENVFIGEWPEHLRRSIDDSFKGWIITREVRNEDLFATRELYRAEFGVTRLTGRSIEELCTLADELPREVSGSIVPVRGIDDTARPKQYERQPEVWPEHLACVSEQNRDRLLKMLGR